MAKKKGKKRFKGTVSRNAQKQQRGASYGHLNLPKGLSIFKEEPGSRVNLDILPYEVTAANHPDRDDEYEIAFPGVFGTKGRIGCIGTSDRTTNLLFVPPASDKNVLSANIGLSYSRTVQDGMMML